MDDLFSPAVVTSTDAGRADDLASALRDLHRVGKLQNVSIIRTARGYQANFMHDDRSCRVDIRADPVDALLVAIGAVGTLEMNRKNGA